MTAVMMPGAPVAAAVFADLVPRIAALIDRGFTPGLGTILVGNESASSGYIRMKQEKAAELGCESPHIHLDDHATQADLVAAIHSFNDDPAVDAMLAVLRRVGVVSPEMEADQHQPRRPPNEWSRLLREIGFASVHHHTFELGLNHLMVASRPARCC